MDAWLYYNIQPKYTTRVLEYTIILYNQQLQ